MHLCRHIYIIFIPPIATAPHTRFWLCFHERRKREEKRQNDIPGRSAVSTFAGELLRLLLCSPRYNVVAPPKTNPQQQQQQQLTTRYPSRKIKTHQHTHRQAGHRKCRLFWFFRDLWLCVFSTLQRRLVSWTLRYDHNNSIYSEQVERKRGRPQIGADHPV